MFPRWLSWVFLLFLGYILLTGNFAAQEQQQTVAPGSGATEAETKDFTHLRALIDGDRWAKALKPDYQPEEKPCSALVTEEGKLPAHAIIEQTGEGEPADCGDTLTVAVQRIATDGSFASASEQELSLGKQSRLDSLIIGMRVGETRLIYWVPTKADATAISGLKSGQLQALRITRIVAPTSEQTPE